jgi:hypothetical protein
MMEDGHRAPRHFPGPHNRAIELDPGGVAAFVGHGYTCRAVKRYRKAMADLTHAVWIDAAKPGP